ADGIDVDLDGVLQEAVDEHRSLGRQPALLAEGPERRQLGHGPPEVLLVVHDLHGPPAEDVAGAHERGVADAVDHRQRVVDGRGCSTGRLWYLQAGTQRVPAFTVLGQVDGL